MKMKMKKENKDNKDSKIKTGKAKRIQTKKNPIKPCTFFFCRQTGRIRSRIQDVSRDYMVITEADRLGEHEDGTPIFVQNSNDAAIFARNMGWKGITEFKDSAGAISDVTAREIDMYEQGGLSPVHV
jgi:hypothetical protein